MTRQILFGAAIAIMSTGPVSALTMTPVSEKRGVFVEAEAGQDFQSDQAVPFVPFTGEVDDEIWAEAHEDIQPFLRLPAGDNDNLGELHGASAMAHAYQYSSLGPLSIVGEGSVDASGNHGNVRPFPGGGGFAAHSSSTVIVEFMIDESAVFDLSGFIQAGNQLAKGPAGNGVENLGHVSLTNTDTNESLINEEVVDDGLKFDLQGKLDPGTYLFSLFVNASVLGEPFIGDPDGEAEVGVYGYAASASFAGDLVLSPMDQPIPEPVTTTLAGMGLGALLLRTTRRRRVTG